MKPRVGIDDVAFSLGYKLNRQAGVGRYIELILPDGRGEKLDTIVISHPQEKERQKYFHRNTGKRGDVVDFIGENLNRFNKFGRNQWEVIGKGWRTSPICRLLTTTTVGIVVDWAV